MLPAGYAADTPVSIWGYAGDDSLAGTNGGDFIYAGDDYPE